MKKIMNGKKYDTSTAQKVGYGQHVNNGSFSDFTETLYKKTTGEYFLLGSGGPMSPYSETSGGTTYGIDKIIPMSEEEARTWGYENLLTSIAEGEFGEVPE